MEPSATPPVVCRASFWRCWINNKDLWLSVSSGLPEGPGCLRGGWPLPVRDPGTWRNPGRALVTDRGSLEPKVTRKWRPRLLEGRRGKVLTDSFMPWFSQVFSCGSGSVGSGHSVKAAFEQAMSRRLLVPAWNPIVLGSDTSKLWPQGCSTSGLWPWARTSLLWD